MKITEDGVRDDKQHLTETYVTNVFEIVDGHWDWDEYIRVELERVQLPKNELEVE